MDVIDLRSDTVTLPDEEMREAMASAEVGDDVYGEDPTVNRLQETAAELVGKEAALFVPSGTMGNQLAVLAHTERGNEVILDESSHIYSLEVGASAMFGGVHLRPVSGLISGDGPRVLEHAFKPPNIHFPPTALVCLENTFNRGSGIIIPPETMGEMYSMAKERGLSVHLDGARVFNASVATKRDVKKFTAHCDSVMFCLSKGLGAPVGSILAGSREFIEKARRYRKAMGGGMRQAGVLAAAGLVALRHIPNLATDHENARRLAEAMAERPGIELDLDKVQTNIIIVRITDRPAAEFVEALAAQGVKCNATGPDTVRLVTHKDVSREDIEKAISVIQKV